MFQTLEQFDSEVERLVVTSDKNHFDPFTRVSYPDKLDTDRLQFPEKYISLYHHPVYAELTDEQKWKLSLLESINFFSLNIQGEQALIRELSTRLYRNKFRWDSTPASHYLQHFIHEENAHTFMLAGYCTRYHGSLMPDMTALSSQEPELSALGKDLLFYGRTAVLEYFLGFLNRKAKADEDIEPVVKQIHYFHYLDETRHITFDRLVIEETLKQAKEQGLDAEVKLISKLLQEYSEYVSKRLYNFRIYREIGIENPFKVYQEAQVLGARGPQIQEWNLQSNQLLQKFV